MHVWTRRVHRIPEGSFPERAGLQGLFSHEAIEEVAAFETTASVAIDPGDLDNITVKGACIRYRLFVQHAGQQRIAGLRFRRILDLRSPLRKVDASCVITGWVYSVSDDLSRRCKTS